ncbi:MAG: hypothetical protein HY457_03665 [Parcubacteria group bacterium]|nr:hypothetical protein [Parcubacteria group bacterium]
MVASAEVRVAWLEWLQTELVRITGEDSVAPDQEKQPHEHELGTLGVGLRRLYYLSQVMLQKSLRAKADAVTLRGEKQDGKVQESILLGNQAQLINANFWEACRHEFPQISEKENIGMRKGWVMVWWSDAEGFGAPPDASSADGSGDTDSGHGKVRPAPGSKRLH